MSAHAVFGGPLSIGDISVELMAVVLGRILKNGTDKPASLPQEAPILFHSNIRGRGYYN